MHRRWAGSLSSFLLPGAGLWLAGNKKSGLRWFVGLLLVWLLKVIVVPLPTIPNLIAFVVLSGITLALYGVLIARSYAPVPRIGFVGWLVLLVLALAFALLKGVIGHSFTHPFKMPTGSMNPAIEPGDHLLAQRFAYWFSKPSRGDVIVFNTDQMNAGSLPQGFFYVKRIAALPGETVEINEGRLVINGHALTSPTIFAKNHFRLHPLGQASAFGTNKYLIPEDHYFVIGDNATNSYDSRYYGPIPRKSIHGKITKIYWPLQRIADIR
jgi:signal peptidase I